MDQSKFHLKAGDLQFTFLHTGDIYEMAYKNIMINQWLSNPIDGSLNNIYLRVHQGNRIKWCPLLGIKSLSSVRHTDTRVIWEGNFCEVDYTVTFTLMKQGIWFWEVSLSGTDVLVDVIYGQDLGIAEPGAIRSNEAFVSQYIDHKVFLTEDRGYIIGSRQNQPQQGAFPYLQQGSLNKNVGYSTDGFQFFGLSYKETNDPEILSKDALANEVYQYEFAYTALQSERIKLAGSTHFVFYGLFREDHPQAVTSLEYIEDVLMAWEQEKPEEEVEFHYKRVALSPAFGTPLTALSMDKQEIERYFPDRQLEEWDDTTLLSFFTSTQEHVVLKEKELLVERPHGHILMAGDAVSAREKVLTSTCHMNGIFNSQLVVGNTSYNKMLSNTRNSLNVMKTSGQRVYIEIDGVYRLLALPSLFEMGFNYARWYYKTQDDLIVITNFTVVDSPEVQLNVRSVNGKEYRFLVTNQVTMNNNEYAQAFGMEWDGNAVTFRAGIGADSHETYPELCYRMRISGAEMKVLDERIFAEGLYPHSASLAVLKLGVSSEWNLTVHGLQDGEKMPFSKRDPAAEIERYRHYLKDIMNGFHLEGNVSVSEEIKKMNSLAWWYTHNMLVHYAVPHGLEQYGGAAWGTRDVCQGPTEFFLAVQKYDAVRDILKTVYSHQYEDDGNWPQWFMFDRYFKIQQEESHGDIIVWPLKVLADYIAVTKDYSILNERVPYTLRGSFEFSHERATILEHAKKEISYIKQHFLHDTYLSSYGDGDWDDTLQPANANLKRYLVSSWTVALTYQVTNTLARVLQDVYSDEATELYTLATGIKEDFRRYILGTEVIPGFVYLEEPGKPKLMLHPTDTETGIQYRLLPMTRSMIGELLTPEEAERHYETIKKHLFHVDGVRLMDRPAKYSGGVSFHFKRAEQAANFGREIGLQYVHAHIRFVEAMAKLGKHEEAWKGLQTINPVQIQQVLPNAARRQSNAYFSSSDGDFKTRYEAQERFDELRDGSVSVKGGWRIYSSGPGIYMNQLISNCLGIRMAGGDLVVDPVLPKTLDGLKMHFQVLGHPVTFTYRLGGSSVKNILINGQNVEAEQMSNRYRHGGVRITHKDLSRLLTESSNLIEIVM
ncbi:cellobiose phosphorylase [Peribacillus deserti]|uniref:Cellobiose phosphorylase n=1 Tax=Peribacillus deserti TaxID=673318 RepID=A0ABS2QLB0_9BACI|nr:cellobiose phosphorylase [Peribacillus deserti]MBM7693795.1 cellobiose phosphorylase [Peribacillus deserti]